MDENKKTLMAGLVGTGAALLLVFAVASSDYVKCDDVDLRCQKAMDLAKPSIGMMG